MASTKKNKVLTNVKQPEQEEKSFILPVLASIFIIIFLCSYSFSPGLKNDFVDWDDYKYIHTNPLIKDLSFNGLKQIFVKPVMGNYHPLSIFSLGMNYKYSKLQASSYHETNLFFHVVNSIFIFLLVFQYWKRVIPSLFVALLFAIHPLHVESVSWASERKDVLYSFFFLAGLLCYQQYIMKGLKKFLWFTLILFILSCLSKGMAVTFPLIMLLMDYLYKRNRQEGDDSNGISVSNIFGFKKLLFEKISFFLVAMVFGIVAIYVQKLHGGIIEYPEFNFLKRILLASYGFVFYLYKMLIPINLSAIYPYPGLGKEGLPVEVLVSPLIVISLALLAYYSRRFTQEIWFGFLFYTISILPVLQFIPVGEAFAADRYFYISSIGLFFIAGSLLIRITDSPSGFVRKSYLNYVIVLVCLLGLIPLTRKQALCWKNDLSLFTQALKAQPNAALPYNKVGIVYQRAGKMDEALSYYEKALAIKPNYSLCLSNVGLIYHEKKDFGKALEHYNKALESNNRNVDAWYNKGNTLYMTSDYPGAIDCYSKAIEINSNYVSAYKNRALAYRNIKEDLKAQQDQEKVKEIEQILKPSK